MAKTLFHGAGNNGIITILDENTYRVLKRMYQRASDGENWDVIHADTPYPTGIATFVSDEYWDGELAQHATGTYSDMAVWLKEFHSKGGVMEVNTIGSNSVPFSNQTFGEEDQRYVLTTEQVCEMFDITPDMIRDRPVLVPVA